MQEIHSYLEFPIDRTDSEQNGRVPRSFSTVSKIDLPSELIQQDAANNINRSMCSSCEVPSWCLMSGALQRHVLATVIDSFGLHGLVRTRRTITYLLSDRIPGNTVLGR
jgi:hypothetical protein